MKKLIRVGVLLLAVIIGILVLVKYNQNKEQKEFVRAADYIFDMIDDSSLSLDAIYLKKELLKKVNDQKISDALKNIDFYSVVICDKDAVFFAVSGELRSVEGYVIVRNDVKLAENYPQVGYDEGIRYEKIADRVYYYWASI